MKTILHINELILKVIEFLAAMLMAGIAVMILIDRKSVV